MYIIKREEESKKVLAYLENEGMCVISGPAGSGKTFFVRQLLANAKNVTYINTENTSLDYEELIRTELSDCLYVFDGVESIEKFMELDFFERLKCINGLKIILVTRQAKIEKKIPNVILTGVSREEMTLLIADRFDGVSEEDADFIFNLFHGHIAMTLLCAEALSLSYTTDDLIRTFVDPEIAEIINDYATNFRSKEKTPTEAREVLFQIRNFGPISQLKLDSWNNEIDVDNAIKILLENQYIANNDGKFYSTMRIMKFSEKEKRKYSEKLLKVFISDSQKEQKDGHDIKKLIDILKETDIKIRFIVDYYEETNDNSSANDINEIKTMLKQALKKQDENSEKLERIEYDLRINQKQILEEIQRLEGQLPDNSDIKTKLEELSQIIQNPKKSKLAIANEILGAIGSAASISSVMGVSNWPSAISSLSQTISNYLMMIP